MTRTLLASLLLGTALVAPAVAQTPIPIQVVATGITNPAGFFEVNGEIFVGGPSIIHLAPADRSNPNPLDTGTYVVDDGLQCPAIPISAGQIYQVNDILAYVAVTDPGKGSDNKPLSGAYTFSFAPDQTFPACPEGNLTHLVPDKGLNGPLATSIAPSPQDGKQYVGFAKNGNIDRINGPNVEAVGNIPSGQPIWGQYFAGSDDYLGAGNGFYVLRNAPACSGNQNNCGVPTLITGGTTVAVKGDNNGHVYFAQLLGGIVTRLNLADGSFTQIASGLTFANQSATLGFDHHGNLWIGGGNNLYRILAANLPQ